jgi:membrane-associated PAP2 superfamily phosphatase
VVFAAALALLEVAALDPVLAHAWYFDEVANRWIGSGHGAWWARDLLHTGGRWFVRSIAALALVCWALSFVSARAHPWRHRAGFVVLAILVSTTVVGALKAITNVDCPWDLAGFGGGYPYVPLFADRPDALPRAACFPGAHASSGFALVCFYFVLREAKPRLAGASLGVAIAIGLAFSIGQEARGAHFLSHDLTSAALVWFIQLALYGVMLRPSSAKRRSTRAAAQAPDARAPWRSTERPPGAT